MQLYNNDGRNAAWSNDELEAYFVVIDSAGQKLAYVYFEDEPGRRSAAKLLTKDETRRRHGKAARPCSRQWEPFYDLDQKQIVRCVLILNVCR